MDNTAPIKKFRRRFNYDQVKTFGSHRSSFPVPDLTKLQTAKYSRFLQEGVDPDQRERIGLEEVLQEAFPISDAENKRRLEYVSYELEKPRFTSDECRQLKLTYGKPLRVRIRLTGEGVETVEEDIYLGDIPIMLGGGEFIINGAERVEVSQLHRSPGIDYLEIKDEDRHGYSCRIIPERGCWVELLISNKNEIHVKVDQATKLPAMLLLRAMDVNYASNEALVRAFHGDRVEKISLAKGLKVQDKINGKIAMRTILDPKTGEVLTEFGQEISEKVARVICTSGEKSIEVLNFPGFSTEAKEQKPQFVLMNSIQRDPSGKFEGDDLAKDEKTRAKKAHDNALMRYYALARSGNPKELKKAEDLFRERFGDENRYRLGKVGRFRMNRKLGTDVPEDKMLLSAQDLIDAIKYLYDLHCGIKTEDGEHSAAEVDDIDNLGNRRLRTIDELLSEELRKGFLKLARTAKEHLNSQKDGGTCTPRSLINQKAVSSALDFFFGRGELSQVVDQTNPLSMLTHERRLSALGPGGLNRKRASFEVRDVHATHYGRICPIETPEGTNIGLISSLAIYAGVDEYGFLVAPYRKVEDGKITDKVEWLRADAEFGKSVVPADVHIEEINEKGYIGKIVPDSVTKMVIARKDGDYVTINVEDVQYIDVAPNQMVGVSAGLIPFLEHDDANRALMGANMQRQAVPLLISEAPLVGTGLETAAALNSSLLVRARRAGIVTYVDALKIVIEGDNNAKDTYLLRKFKALNERTCQNQKPIVRPGQKVAEGEVIADGACTDRGDLALGRNVLVAFMVWDGFNYEDAIILSEELVQNDTYTSLHIEELDEEIREVKSNSGSSSGKPRVEEFTRDIPNVSEDMRKHLDEFGIVKIGTYVSPGDILVGKVVPKNKQELSPEEKLLHAIFGRTGEDVKDASLRVSPGMEGIVIGTHKIQSRSGLSEEKRREYDSKLAKIDEEGNAKITECFGAMIDEMEKVSKKQIVDKDGNSLTQERTPKDVADTAKHFSFKEMCRTNNVKEDSAEYKKLATVWNKHREMVEDAIDERDHKRNTHQAGDQLKRGVLKRVIVYIATKRVISVGDKMAGRHGNKGVISRILPKEDMPFMADGTPIQIMLNPLGVPSRMNVGQILETHLGWAASKLGYRAVAPVFGGATEEQINDELEKAGLPRHGKVQLYDGRTGEPFGQETTVGYIYMLKLHHLVDDKVHARSTGPYSLITQQPLGGKARSGGQRFGEMEFWALEAYGAAYTIQELLTVKSDDVEGRTKIYESMVNGKNSLKSGIPASFDVLVNEIKGLALDMQLISTHRELGATGNDLA